MNEEKQIEISWVTDPYDMNYRNQNETVLNALQNTKIICSIHKYLDQSVYYYKYIVIADNNINFIYDILNKISFSPLMFPINVTNEFYIKLRLNIIKILVFKYLLTEVKYFSFFYYKETKLVQPNNNGPIYRNPKYFAKLINAYMSIPEDYILITDNINIILNLGNIYPHLKNEFKEIDGIYYMKYYEPFIQLIKNNINIVY